MKTVQCLLPDETYAMLQSIAKSRLMTLAAYVRMLIVDDMQAKGPAIAAANALADAQAAHAMRRQRTTNAPAAPTAQVQAGLNPAEPQDHTLQGTPARTPPGLTAEEWAEIKKTRGYE